MCHVLSCQFVLTPPILLPVYGFISPSCFPSLPFFPSFAPFIISLCLQFRVGSLPNVRCRLCPALPCPALFSLVLPCSALSCPVQPCPALFSLVLPCSALSCPVQPCPVLFSLVLPCPALFSLVLPCSALSCPVQPCLAC